MGTLGNKITRAEATRTARHYGEVFEEGITGFTSITIAGSYRRNKMEELGDVDLIVMTESGEFITSEIRQILNSNETVKSVGKKKFTFITDDGVQVDAYACNCDNYGAMLLFLTGSASFNIKMRYKAKELGYKLSQYGLFKASTDELVSSRTEEDIFNQLKYLYTPPARR